MIVKYVETLHNGIQSLALSRYAIGYILRGTKYVYDGDKRQAFNRGDVFYLGSATTTWRTSPKTASPSSRCSSTTRPPTCSASCST